MASASFALHTQQVYSGYEKGTARLCAGANNSEGADNAWRKICEIVGSSVEEEE